MGAMDNGQEQENAAERYEGELIGSEQVGPGTRLATFSLPRLARPPRPGRFFMVKVDHPGFPLFGRAFSVFDHRSLSVGDEVSFLVRAVGKGTALINAAAPGTRALLVGPAGCGFPDPPRGKRLILVAGGTGVAPFHLLMRRACDARRPERAICLLQGARDAPSLYLHDRFRKFPFDVRAATEDGSVGAAGMVDRLLRARLDEEKERGGAWIFACGPEGMLRAAARLGEEYAAPTFLSLETRMACGFGVCNGCAVPVADSKGGREGIEYLRVCLEGPVFEASLLSPFLFPRKPHSPAESERDLARRRAKEV